MRYYAITRGLTVDEIFKLTFQETLIILSIAFLGMSFFIAIADKGILMGQVISNLVLLWFGYGTAKFLLRWKNG